MKWTLNDNYNPNVVDEAGKVICSIHGYGTPEGQRNARLICVATKMYELLKRALPRVPAESWRLRADIERVIKVIDKEDDE